MKLILVHQCEAEPAEDRPGVDPGLSELGVRQARAVGEEMVTRVAESSRVEAVWTSRAHAAITTGEVIADTLGAREVLADEAFDGLTEAWIRERFESGALDAEVLSYLEDVQSRAWDLVQTLTTLAEPPAEVVCVTHAATIGSLVCKALGMPLSDLRRFEIDVASVSVIDFQTQRNRMVVVSLNDACHLEEVSSK